MPGLDAREIGLHWKLDQNHLNGGFWPSLCQSVIITILVERLNRLLSELPIEVDETTINLSSFDMQIE